LSASGWRAQQKVIVPDDEAAPLSGVLSSGGDGLIVDFRDAATWAAIGAESPAMYARNTMIEILTRDTLGFARHHAALRRRQRHLRQEGRRQYHQPAGLRLRCR
jgi:hypothetical protein